jgi:hypothetical protein
MDVILLLGPFYKGRTEKDICQDTRCSFTPIKVGLTGQYITQIRGTLDNNTNRTS